MADLRDIRTWREGLGLLPVPLFGIADRNAYVLLNGTQGSFCLYLDDQVPGHDSRSAAWSANVGHSINIDEDFIYIQRWDELPIGAFQRLPVTQVTADLERFHRTLEASSPPSEFSIIAHAVRVFRTLRAALGRGFDGTAALQGFLFLVAAAIDNADRGDVRLGRWRLGEGAKEIALSLNNTIWDSILEDLLSGSRLYSLRSDLSLTLRHASGMLFQEAHYAAVFDAFDQLLLPGLAPKPISVKPSLSAIGLHFTPPAIVRSMVEEALIARGDSTGDITVFDPACGSGEFLREVLRQLQLKGYLGRVRLIGFDISQAACAMANFTLAWETRGLTDAQVEINISCCNALADDVVWPVNVDIILMNPPFQSWQEMPEGVREEVRKALGTLYKYRPDLSAVFLLRSLGSLAIDGVLGTILPVLFLDGVAFEGLRDALASSLNTVLVARLGSYGLFYAALVDACFYIGRRAALREPPLALWASHRSHSTSAALRTLRRLRALESPVRGAVQNEAEDFSFYPNPALGKKGVSWAPRPYREWKLAQSVTGLPRVGDRFAVRQGVRTGLNRAFLILRSEWLRLPNKEQPYFRPAVFHDSLRSGRFHDDAYVFYPYGAYTINTEDELCEVVPSYYRESLALKRADLRARKWADPEHWWLLARPREWQVHRVPKMMSAYFGDSGSFAWDPEGSVVVVQGFSWIPKKKKKTLPRKMWLAYLALVNSDIFTTLLAAHSHHVSGGQWNLSKRFVEPIPLPDLEAATVGKEATAALSELGGLIHADGLDGLSKDDLVRLREVTEDTYLLAKIERNDGETTEDR